MKKLINKYQVGGWFPIGYDNNIYQSKIGILPEVTVTAKGDPRKVNNDYYKAHAAERSAFQDKVARRVDQDWVPQTMLGLASVPLDVEGVIGLRLLYEQLPKWVLNVPKNPNRYYRIVDKRAIDDYISSKKIRSAQAAKESGVDTEGPKQAGRFLLKKNHDYNMFSKGEPWQGGLATRDKTKPYILVSKENTGKTVWEQSNVDFRHKGHSGIYRPRYEGDLNATPSIYFDYYKPKLIGYTKHSL